ncbi:MAG: ricin-type beta-trefoil lectin domain protein [Polyangiaceae bacterium]
MRTIAHWSVLGSLVGLLSACGVAPSEGSFEAVAESSSPLLLTGAKWPDAGIHVCFETRLASDGSGNSKNPHTRADWATLFNLVRDTANASWGRAANLYFYGFEDCASNVASNNPGTIAINLARYDGEGGNTDIGYSSSRWTRMRLDPSQNGFDGQIMHEFGHALGFSHEWDRADNPHNTGCTVADGNSVGKTSDYLGTKLDIPSIMNYSYDQGAPGCALPRPFRLSAWDIVGVQNAYGRKRAGQIVNPFNLCVDIPLPYDGSGAWLQTFACNGNTNQRFRWLNTSQLYAPAYANAFMDVPAGTTTPGQQIHTFSQNSPASANQQWVFRSVQVKGIGDKCLSAQSFAVGSLLVTRECNGAADQAWTVNANSGQMSISSGSQTLCAELPNGNEASGSFLRLVSCTGGTAQRFSLTNLGEIKFVNQCFDVVGGDVSDGRAIQMYSCKAASDRSKVNQQWHFSGAIHSALASNLCVDVRGASRSYRAAVQTYTCNGAENQTWDYYFYR